MQRLASSLFYTFATHSKFCIIGGGTGGLNLSARLIRSQVNAKDIRIFDAAEKHYYQPGWTMVGGDLCKSDLTEKDMDKTLPSGINHTKKNVQKINPEKKQVTTQDGDKYTYDHLIVASGLKYNWQKVKGAKEALDDSSSPVGTIYQLKYAEKTARLGKQFKGGKALFTEPVPPIKCAGAPQKILYLWADHWQKAGIRADVQFLKPAPVLFGVPKYSEALTKVAKQYGIKVSLQHNLVQINGNTAIFQNLGNNKERIQRKFDFLHFVPPMSAHKYIAESGLADAAGYLDVDKGTLRHTKFPTVWGIGDCTNTPNSKTAAAIFSQTQVLVKNILQAVRNPHQPLTEQYGGYSSCPLFVGDNRLILAQFKYGGAIDETFFKDQEKPRILFYFLKRFGFPFAYWNLVPRGNWAGKKGPVFGGV